jgi:predicted PurR-regulated permease PerM
VCLIHSLCSACSVVFLFFLLIVLVLVLSFMLLRNAESYAERFLRQLAERSRARARSFLHDMNTAT